MELGISVCSRSCGGGSGICCSNICCSDNGNSIGISSCSSVILVAAVVVVVVVAIVTVVAVVEVVGCVSGQLPIIFVNSVLHSEDLFFMQLYVTIWGEMVGFLV